MIKLFDFVSIPWTIRYWTFFFFASFHSFLSMSLLWMDKQNNHHCLGNVIFFVVVNFHLFPDLCFYATIIQIYNWINYLRCSNIRYDTSSSVIVRLFEIFRFYILNFSHSFVWMCVRAHCVNNWMNGLNDLLFYLYLPWKHLVITIMWKRRIFIEMKWSKSFSFNVLALFFVIFIY